MGFELFGKRGHRLSTGACRVARVMMRDLFGEILSNHPAVSDYASLARRCEPSEVVPSALKLVSGKGRSLAQRTP